MKIAYLILAHNQPLHLFRMVTALNSKNASFFIHIDKKSDISLFNKLNFQNNVHFIKERSIVTHEGFFIVKAILNLIKTAVADGDFDYFQLLSGWDYPIKNHDYIDAYLNEHYPLNFICFYPLTDGADWVDFVRKYYLIDLIGSFPKIMRKPLKALHNLELKLPINRPFIKDTVPYRGSAWWCLNKTTIHYLLNFLDSSKGKEFLNYYKHVSGPDEIIFQTIIFNSPLAESCRYYDRDFNNSSGSMKNENKAYLHYIDWDPLRENPAILNMGDFLNLKHTEFLYARKFDAIKSRSLLDAIDSEFMK